jgi:ferric-dicitrate binding protein FerR (iron transport regulator)
METLGHPAVHTGPWRDQLVELHVLAANGDTEAAAAAERWLAADPEAQKAWTTVERACRQVELHPDPTWPGPARG